MGVLYYVVSVNCCCHLSWNNGRWTVHVEISMAACEELHLFRVLRSLTP